MTLKLDVSKEDFALIKQIADRADAHNLIRNKSQRRHWYTRQMILMDMTATHLNGCPMDFARLLAADAFNFTHDVAGIAAKIDRTNGRLMDNFRPRFALRSGTYATSPIARAHTVDQVA